jgi:hypothetical protein
VLIVESGPHGARPDDYQCLRDLLEEAGARCSTTSLACPGDGGSLDAGCLASIIADSSARCATPSIHTTYFARYSFKVDPGRSTRCLELKRARDLELCCKPARNPDPFKALKSRIVHIGCEALRSGGDLVLEWAMGAVEMEVGDAAEILSISASHSGLMTTTTDKPGVDAPGAGYFGGIRTGSGNVQEEEACGSCFDERREEEGLRNRGSGGHRPSGEREEGLETSPRNGPEGVGVEAQQTFRGCSRRYSRRLRRCTLNHNPENPPNPEPSDLEAHSQS